jgi:integrase
MSGTKPVGKHQDKVLTAAAVRAITKPGLHADGNGLYLKVQSSGTKNWIQRIVIHGKRRDLGLGAITLVPLSEAREAALQNRKIARSGGDPVADKRLALAVLTFEEAALQVHELNAPHWRNDKHAAQWLSTLQEYAFPFFGQKRLADIDGSDVLRALTPIWHKRPETARRVKQRMGTVFKWAMAKGWRTDNPAETVTQALPRHDRSKVKHRLALPYSAVASALQKVRSSAAGAATRLAFEFLVLTATRSGEVREAVWSEVDFENKEWVIPASRMKAKRPHRVPLSDRAIAVLNQAKPLKQDDSDLIFPGTKPGRALSDMTLSKLMKDQDIPAVPHGFRSSFRDWAGEATNHAREVVEFALAHVIQDKAEAAYARSDLFEKRKRLMVQLRRFDLTDLLINNDICW